MFKKILIANRGEIAIRIMRACREMGIESVAVYSTADASSLHVQFAGEAYCIGGPKAQDSYINMHNILTVALAAKCDAIHPGFGFLAENSEFAGLCRRYNIAFIGPTPEVIELMGDKSSARRLMAESGIPVVPGSEGLVATASEARLVAEKIGYPLLVKAAAGGGGRGMRKVFSAPELESNFLTARAEAEACFGSGEMYIEKLIEEPKHIEFQLLADQQGNIIHLGERDCSVQRRNQKLMEETPSPRLSPELRQEMGDMAVRAGRVAGYQSAGTVEFVVDAKGKYYFIEMNTRIQVEHPITELLTGVDIVKEQIRIAAGLPLSRRQEDITFSGCAIECRINAEKPDADFRPSTGKIQFLHLPAGFGVRVDTFLYTGYEVNPFYDSMLGKIIVWGNSRLEAIRRMRRALEETLIEGIDTNLWLQHAIMYHPRFLWGDYNTSFIETNLQQLLNSGCPLEDKVRGQNESLSTT